MEKPKHPRNVQAVLEYFGKVRPDMLSSINRVFDLNNPPNSTSEAIGALILLGFEAGREFQKSNPDVQSGIGYL